MRSPINVLESLTKKSQEKNYKFQRLYRNLYNPDFYWEAYRNIYANKGSMTAGVDGTTIDGMSDGRIEKIIATLKDQSYKPNPARREYIEKKNSNKKRPLGIPSGNDKLVQEVVRMILESIYEPNFSNISHGFRPNRSCHTSLKQIQNTFTGVKWFVEGDIEKCFDSFDHHIIIELLKKRIDDEKFIALMWKFLKAGYMEQWEYRNSYEGVPQGSGISPILSNIYLSELDKYMEEYKANFDTGKSSNRKVSTEYAKARWKADKFKLDKDKIWDSLDMPEKKECAKTLRALKADMRKVTRSNPKDSTFKSIQYSRYADDFIIGVIGSKEDAEKIKADVKSFLYEKLNLNLSDKKTKVTHSGDKARFLGYDIMVSREQCAKKRSDGIVMRTQNQTVKLLVPREKWVAKLQEYKTFKITINNNGKERYKTLHRGKLINKSDIEILSTYNSEIRGLYNFYSIANNSYKIGRFAAIMKYSMLKTFANKYRTKVSKIKARFVKGKDFTVEYYTKGGIKTAIYYNGGFKRKKEAIKSQEKLQPHYKKYDKFNSLKNRIRMGVCELCNKKSEDIAFHQVKKLKDLKGKNEWERLMLERRRKTLVVCPKCHSEIHT